MDISFLADQQSARLQDLLRKPLRTRLSLILSGPDAGNSLLLRPRDLVAAIRRVMELSGASMVVADHNLHTTAAAAGGNYTHLWQSEFAFQARCEVEKKKDKRILRLDPAFALVSALEAAAAAMLHSIEQCKCGDDEEDQILLAAGRARVSEFFGFGHV